MIYYRISKLLDSLFRVRGKKNHKYLKGFDVWEGNIPGSYDLRDFHHVMKYGFSYEEIYNFDFSLTLYVYERLKCYLENADSIVDLEYYKYDVIVFKDKDKEYYSSLTYRDLFDGKDLYDKETKTLTQRECINLIIDYLEYFITEYERENRLYDEEYERLGLSTMDEKLKSEDLKNVSLQCLIEETKSYIKRKQAFVVLSQILDSLWI